MANVRVTRDKMRRDLHREAAIPALYLALGADDPNPLVVTIRVFKSVVKLGKGEDGGDIERRDIQPRILFLREEVSMPARNAIVSVVAGEAYAVGEALPPDGISITAMVAPLPIARTTGLPVPGGS